MGDIADIVEPVPERAIPIAVLKQPGGLDLFKREFRSASRLATKEQTFIPEVQRTSYESNQSAFPAPSYLTPIHLRGATDLQRFGQPSRPVPPLRPGSHHKRFRSPDNVDWADQAFLNTPGKDYQPVRAGSARSARARPPSGRPGSRPASGRPQTAQTSFRGPMSPNSSVAERVEYIPGKVLRPTSARPVASPPPSVSQYIYPQQPGPPLKLPRRPYSSGPALPGIINSPVSLPEVGGEGASSGGGGSISGRPPSRERARSAVHPPRQTISESDLRHFVPPATHEPVRSIYTRSGSGVEGWEQAARPAPLDLSSPSAYGLPGRMTQGQDTARSTRYSSQETRLMSAGGIQLRSRGELRSFETYLESGADALRSYKMVQKRSASSHRADTTFSRRPAMAHHIQPHVPTPVERIAANHSPFARGLSPRTLEAIAPGGISGASTDPLEWGRIAWDEIDLEVELDGLLEAEEAQAEKVKHSFLPLEMFADPELDAHSPEGWLATSQHEGGVMALTPMYNIKQDAYEFHECVVESWNATESVFHVRVLSNDLRKPVKRLNLIFAAENRAQHERMVVSAKTRREEAEAAYRYWLYIDNLDGGDVVPTYDFTYALEMMLGRSAGITAATVDRFGEQLVQEHEGAYVRSVKTAILEYKRLHPKEEGRLRVLRLPPRHPKPAAPEIGVLPVTLDGAAPEFRCSESIEWANETLFVSMPKLVPVLGMFERLMHRVRARSLFVLAGDAPRASVVELSCLERSMATHLEAENSITMETSTYSLEDAGPKPWKLMVFEALQHAHCTHEVQAVESLLFESATMLSDIDIILEVNTGGAHPEDTATMEPGSEGHGCLLQMASMKVADTLRSLLQDSSELFAAYLENFPKAAENSPLVGAPSAYSDLPTIREAWGATPVLRIALTADGEAVAMDPSPDELLESMLEMMDDMSNKLAELQDEFLQAVTGDMRPFSENGWADDAAFRAAVRRVEAVASRGIDMALDLAALYKESNAVVFQDPQELLAAHEADDTPLSMYTDTIQELNSALVRALRTTPALVHTGPICVDAGNLHTQMRARRDATVTALLEQVLGKCRSVNDKVCRRCEQITMELKKAPANSAELIDMENYISECETELEGLMDEIQANKRRDEFLEGWRFGVALKDAGLAMRSYVWPKDMMSAFDRAHERIRAQKESLQRRLKARVEKIDSDLELLQLEVAKFQSDSTNLADQAEYGSLAQALQARISALEEEVADANEEQALYGWKATEFPGIAELWAGLEPYANLWIITSDFNLSIDEWMYGPFKNLEPAALEETVGEWYKKMFRLTKGFNTAEDAHLKRIAEEMKVKLEEFKANLPVIAAICNPGMRGRHWAAMSEIVGYQIQPDEHTSLGSLLAQGILSHEQKLQDLSEGAAREYTLERQLDNMQVEWGGVHFELLPWKNTGGFILKGTPVDEAQALLDDHLIKAQAMLSSPFAKPFVERITAWDAKLNHMQDVFDEWLNCQQKWMYLGPVYGSEEIAKQLPKERRAFTDADAIWRGIMLMVEKNPEIAIVTDSEGLLDDLKAMNEAFTVIERSLNAYLDSKKLAFPRFFFLSNDELIEILSETKEPLNVQPFVKKCFEAVKELVFSEDGGGTITGLRSLEGEAVQFTREVDPTGDANGVERWLLRTEEEIQETLQSITTQAVTSYAATPREQWILEWPGQVVLAVSQVYWTREVVGAIKAGQHGLEEYGKKCSRDLEEEVKLVRGELTGLQRATVGALVVIDVHARDVVVEMVQDRVSAETDFNWQSRLRYYWEDDSLLVRMLNAECRYGYEYLGNSSRLVITPLTDRCYRTLLGAIHLNLGGAPAGPAGTGKTESTKDLSKAVAIQCVVFNCSDGLDYLAMGKFFKGLAACGAWACFDEFNRIELEVLSVVAQQVLTIQRAVAAKAKKFVFEGVELTLKLTVNVFITMNPGYAGRSELPDNLKALFRDVAMMVPDYALISEIILYSYGYLDARVLGQKLVQTYRLCSEQLSSQDHYDYGMRAVISVLRAAGNLKRRFPDESEHVLMLRAISDVNLPKFLDEDVPLFKGILSDLFPGLSLPDIDYANLTAALDAACAARRLQPLPAFFEKCIQLYEMIVVRHGLMLVGYSFGMKSSAISVLADALTRMAALGQGEFNTRHVAINPKAITMGQLYGEDDPVSKEWTDGVLAVKFRQFARDTTEDRKWLVLDGPVDAIWIENMNTVLDDNKKLCLNSGEIIAMQGLMNLIFEVQDLAVASPATVSRCGMVYVQPSLLGWRPLVLSWLDGLPEDAQDIHKRTLLAMFDWLVPVSLRIVSRACRLPVRQDDIHMVQSLCSLCQASLHLLFGDRADTSQIGGEIGGSLEATFLFSLIWSLGAAVDTQTRATFDKELRRVLSDSASPEFAPFVAPSTARALKKPIPPEGEVFDYLFDLEKGSWRAWMATVEAQAIPTSAEYSHIIVTTPDVVRYTHLMRTLIAALTHALLVGPTGTGKSRYVVSLLATLPDSAWSSLVFNFSARTSANMTQDIIDGKLDKRRKGVYGPPPGRRCVIFVDDLNMPAVEVYGAQPPIELLRQYMDYGGWYDRKDNSFRTIQDVQFVAAMGPPGGGRNNVTYRYLHHFNLISVTEFNEQTMHTIFGALVDWWMGKYKYGDDILQCNRKLVTASLAIYDQVRRDLLPTPAKSHYTFNLRDLSKIFQGLQSARDTVADPHQLIRLWAHETLRVFHDRLIDDHDRAYLVGLVAWQCEVVFRVELGVVAGRLANGKGEVGAEELRKLMFADFLVPGAEPKYREVEDWSQLQSVVEEYLSDYNSVSRKPMNLVMFLYAMEHVARICRILRHPWGHALLVGVGGSGRQSLTKLAACIEDYHVMEVEVTKAYSRADWKDDLKNVLKHAGERGKDTIFLFTDMQIKEENMVEDISNMLNTGDVPNLFDSGEQAGIGENIRSKAKKAKMDGGRQQLYQFFISEVKAHLHVVLAFSPVGDAFRNRLRLFPSLVTCTTINWFTLWPQDALQSVAERSLAPLTDLDEEQKRTVAAICMEFHSTARELAARYHSEAGRHFYTTPTMYLQLLDTYISLKDGKQEEVATKQTRYEIGLEKLLSTAAQVLEMQEELTALKPQLEVSSKETDALMETIARETVEADKVKSVVSAEEAKANEEASKVQAIKDECESDLQQALPMLKEAIKALDTLTKNDISEVKGMKSPPAPVKLVMEAVCILKGLGPTKVKDAKSGQMKMDWWVTSLGMLNDMSFLDSLRNFDKDNVPPAVINKLKPYLKNPDFQPKKIKKVSKAAFGLCSWVRAMEAYDRVLKVVRPKQAALKEAQAELDVVMAALSEKQAELKKVEDKLAALNADLSAAQAKKANLEAEVQLCSEKLTRAQALITGLGGEKSRWTQAAAELGALKVQLMGDTLLAAGMVSYFGPFTAGFRDAALSKWHTLLRDKGLPCSEDFSLVTTLGNPVRIQQWNLHGLPKDEFSANNGIMMFASPKFPLCIDPQSQTNKWIRSMEGDHNLVVLKQEDANFMRMMETGLQLGRPVLLENVGEVLDGGLDPVLNKDHFKQGNTRMIRMGDNVVEWHPDFRLYMTTKLRNPHYTPEVCTKVALLNFMITPEGLQDQLLGIVVAQERPELEEEKSRLVVQSAENSAKLQEVEDQILRVLSTSEGNILEDGEAVTILQESKRVSDDIGEKQKVAAKTEASIDKARVDYNPIAKHASVLFFTVVEIGNIDPMYQYSLAYFIQLFLRSIKESPKQKGWDVPTRSKALSDHFTYFLFTNVCRSLFEKDKVLFAFKLAVNLRMADGLVDAGELRFLLTGGVAVGDNPHANPAPQWLSEKSWTELCLLNDLPAFSGIRTSVSSNLPAWRKVQESHSPHLEMLPEDWGGGGYNGRLTIFQRLLVLRTLRPDKLVPSIVTYVIDVMGKQYVEPQEFNLSLVYADSMASVPLVFVLSPGSDPMADLLLFADSKNRNVETVSLGQGQEAIAQRKVEEGMVNGSWVVLQNCHLAKSFLPALEDLCEKRITAGEGVHHEFRLWLTSYPSDIFPVSILENSLKMTNEPPKGLRAGLERIYKSDPVTEAKFWDGCSKPAEFHAMLFALGFFHCLVQQRVLYGPVGWNVPYAFNENDLRISQRQLRMFLDEYPKPPLDMLRYTCGECNYGGKVTDAKDRRLLMTMLNGFYSVKVMEMENAPLSNSGNYIVPSDGGRKSYLEFMAELPLIEEPEVFGLHDNATITKDLKDTNQMLSSLLLTQSRSDGGGSGTGKSMEDTLFDTASDILERLPADFDIEAAQTKYPVTYGGSMNTVLCQELGRANVLLRIIRNSMQDLKKAVRGLILMSEEMDVVGQRLFNGKVPELWLKRSFPSLKPLGPYVKEVIERCDFFRSWLDDGPPVVYWLSGFFFTQAFLTGAKQNYARKYRIPIDLIDFDFNVMDGENDVEVPPLDGVFVKGVFLEAASWDYDAHQLGESKPKVLFYPLPPMAFVPCEIAKIAPPPSYCAPMYKTTERRGVLSTTGHSTNFVMDVRLPTNLPESHWIKRGCALITSLDD